MALFDKDETKDFLLFVQNFQMTFDTSGTLGSIANIEYIHTILLGEELCQVDMLSVEVGSMTTTHLNRIISGLGSKFFSFLCVVK